MKNHSSSRSSAALPMLGLTLALLATVCTAAEQGAESDWKQAEAPPQLVAVPESAPAAPQAAVAPPAAQVAAPQQAAAAPMPAPAPVSTPATDARAVTEVSAPTPKAPGAQTADLAPTSAPAPAQENAASAAAPQEEELEPEPAPLQVGDATHNLMDWQSNGTIASTTPRPIAGDVAQRSYARYLKSFEFPIPEHFSSTVKSGSSGGSSSGQ